MSLKLSQAQVDRAIRQYKDHTGALPKGRHFKRIGHNLADVFDGDGLINPTRYRLIKGQWVYVNGPKLDEAVTAQLPGK